MRCGNHYLRPARVQNKNNDTVLMAIMAVFLSLVAAGADIIIVLCGNNLPVWSREPVLVLASTRVLD